MYPKTKSQKVTHSPLPWIMKSFFKKYKIVFFQLLMGCMNIPGILNNSNINFAGLGFCLGIAAATSIFLSEDF